jgi:hypothetical protein
MQSYMFLFLLEYRRAWADDRRAATYRYTESDAGMGHVDNVELDL